VTSVPRTDRPPGRLRGDDGSAVAEFVMITALLLLLFVGAVQLAVFLHVRNLAADVAVQAVRTGTLADQGPADAEQRADELARTTLGTTALRGIDVSSEGSGEGSRLTVRVRVAVPVLGLLPGPWEYTAGATATRFAP